MNKNRPIPTELLKGHARTLILAVLTKAPAHGYAITHEITRRTNQAIAFKQSSLYPMLHELEKDGLITGSWQVVGEDRPKKVYTITEKGRGELAKKLEDWERLVNAVQSITRTIEKRSSFSRLAR